MDILRSQGYYNLKPSFCAVFFPLFEDDGQSAANLARATGMTRQTMNIYVGELKRRGYIKVVRNAQDKRELHVFLTAKGAMLKKVFESVGLIISKEICGNLSQEEVRKLSDLLQKCLE